MILIIEAKHLSDIKLASVMNIMSRFLNEVNDFILLKCIQVNVITVNNDILTSHKMRKLQAAVQCAYQWL